MEEGSAIYMYFMPRIINQRGRFFGVARGDVHSLTHRIWDTVGCMGVVLG